MKKNITLLMLKPDCLKKRIVGKVITLIEELKVDIIGIKIRFLSKKILNSHYKSHKKKKFFKDLLKFMQSGPVIIIILKGFNVVNKVRKVLGNTNPKESYHKTIRFKFGESILKNVAHASSSEKEAGFEVRRFFKYNELL
jgi:nucleoside-diphosphate kinase